MTVRQEDLTLLSTHEDLEILTRCFLAHVIDLAERLWAKGAWISGRDARGPGFPKSIFCVDG